jgi:DNA-binding FadR family transcriptional regulator
MSKKPIYSDKQEDFIDYLVERQTESPNKDIPSIEAISKELGISVACLREQMELARNLGLIKIQPRKGIEIEPYSFTPAVIKSLYYAIKLDRSYFDQFYNLRSHLERAYFKEAAALLTDEDRGELWELTQIAQKKLNGNPIQIPHPEHRKYHLLIYKHLDNAFLKGLLECYWDTYEMVGLSVYTDLAYQKSIWEYHQNIVQYLIDNKIENAYQLMLDHIKLIHHT